MYLHARVTAFIAAAVVAFALTGCGGWAAEQSTAGRLDDSVLTAKAKTALRNGPTWVAQPWTWRRSRVSSNPSGFGRSDRERLRAARLVRSVNQVAEVRNDLAISGR